MTHGMLTRRSMLTLSAACAVRAGFAATPPQLTQDISFIIPVGPGGGVDIYARLIGSAMQKALGGGLHVVPVNVEAGGGGKGVSQLFRARPDGYTIGMLSLPSLFVLQYVRHITDDFTRFSWLCSITKGEPFGLAVRYDSPLRSISDLQELSQRRPVTFTASGPEGVAYFVTIVASRLLGLQTRLITGYRGSSDYVVGAMRGDADAVIAGLSVLHRMERGKTLRLLASFEVESSVAGVPDATTLKLPELAELTALRVIAGPPNLSTDIQSVLARSLAIALADRGVVEYAAHIGDVLQPLDPAQTQALVAAQLRFFTKWREDLRA
jgi:tripartite-type tricarboxylate transporter receptor subunit TctC